MNVPRLKAQAASHDTDVLAGDHVPRACDDPGAPAILLPTVAATLILGIVAGIIYRPWQQVPLSIVDFSEFMPILRRSDSFASALWSVVRYFAEHGRSAIVTYLYIVGNWVMFGDEARAWDVTRSVIMLFNAALCFALLLRLGSRFLPSLFGSIMLVVATPAAAAWSRLTGEMLAATALLAVAFVALDYRSSARWQQRAVLIALSCAFVVLAKEPLIACIPAIVAVACLDVREPIWRSMRTRRALWLLAVTCLLLVPVAVLVVHTAWTAPDTGYVASYSESPTVTRLFTTSIGFITGLLPTRGTIGIVSISALAVLVLGGWALRWRRLESGRVGRELVLLVGTPVLGALVYVPWPRIEAFYALPFFLFGIVLISTGYAELMRGTPLMRAGGTVFATALACIFAGLSFNSARLSETQRALNHDIVGHLVSAANGNSLLVATRWHSPQAWQGPGATLRRAVLDAGVAPARLPAAADVDCAQLRQVPPEAIDRVILLSFNVECGSLREPDRTATRELRWFDFTTLRVGTVQVRADLRLPRVPLASGGDG